MRPVADRERELFEGALDCVSPPERAEYLSRVCGEDEPLRRRIEELLRVHDQAGAFLEGEPAAPSQPLPTGRTLGEGLGTFIGRYKLLEKIGEGGFGVVYMAEQREPVRRKVALKIIKLGMDTRQVVGRFEAERQALALMDHPHIARVLDGGATETGRPYFVMELVRGEPITKFCDDRRLGARERLDLFLSVCGAIQHAHQKGIIHRDIKPSNVLVTLYDDRPVPKVIDFGIAKALQGELTDKTVFTRFHEFLGTPAYMSPEQTQLNGLDADTRSDVYALGVLLYELLTGRPPFDSQELLTAGLDEMRRRIREEDPPRPSTRLRTLSVVDADTVARQRSTQPARLASLLRGDLDWIVLKCLEKDRTRRYETASALAQDIRRHLANEPVTAAAPRLGYKLRKFARRHRAAVATGVGFILLLVLAALVSGTFAVRAFRAEQTARHEAAVAAAVNQFLNEDLFALAEGGAELTPEPTMRALLDRAAAQVEHRFRNQPHTQAAVRATLGQAYSNLGRYDEARVQWEQAHLLFAQTFGQRDRRTLLALSDLALARTRLDPRTQAFELGQAALTNAIAAFGAQDPLSLKCWSRLALLHYRLGNTDDAREAARQVVSAAPLVPELETEELVRALYLFGRMLVRGGERDRGERHVAEALEVAQRRLGETHPVTLRAMNSLAGFYYDHAFKLTEAEQLFRQALRHQRRAFGEAHPTTLTIRNNLSLFYSFREPRRPQLALAHRLRCLRYAPLVEPPQNLTARLTSLLADAARESPGLTGLLRPEGWRRSVSPPPPDWIQRSFDDQPWVEGPPPVVRSVWLRQVFGWPPGPDAEPFVVVQGPGRFAVFLNGRAGRAACSAVAEGLHVFLFEPEVLLTLRAEGNVLAVQGGELTGDVPLNFQLYGLPQLPDDGGE